MSPKRLIPFKDFGKDTGEPLVTLDPADHDAGPRRCPAAVHATEAPLAGEL